MGSAAASKMNRAAAGARCGRSALWERHGLDRASGLRLAAKKQPEANSLLAY